MKINSILPILILFILSCNEISIDTPLQNPKRETTPKSKVSIKKEKLPALLIHGTLTDKSKPLPNVQIKVYSYSKLIQSKISDSNGYYKLDSLPINKTYTIKFSKKNYLGKFCIIEKINANKIVNKDDFPLEITAELYDLDKFDSSIINFTKKEPAGICSFDSITDNLKWDLKTVESYKTKVAKALKTSK